MSETEAIALAQSGNPDAFTVLYELHKTNVFNRCLQLLHNEEEAEDISQEVWILLYRKLPQFKWKSDFKTWLFRITTNKIIGHIRRNNARIPFGAGDAPEKHTPPNQYRRLEILEALDTLSDMERFCVEAEIDGQSLRGFGGANYLRSAQHSLRGQLV